MQINSIGIPKGKKVRLATNSLPSVVRELLASKSKKFTNKI